MSRLVQQLSKSFESIMMSLHELFVFFVYLVPLHIFILHSDASMINKSVYSQEIPSFRPQNSISCIENQPYVWCLPLNYKRENAPWEYRYLTNTSIPWNYEFYFYINDVHEINECINTSKLRCILG